MYEKNRLDGQSHERVYFNQPTNKKNLGICRRIGSGSGNLSSCLYCTVHAALRLCLCLHHVVTCTCSGRRGAQHASTTRQNMAQVNYRPSRTCRPASRTRMESWREVGSVVFCTRRTMSQFFAKPRSQGRGLARWLAHGAAEMGTARRARRRGYALRQGLVGSAYTCPPRSRTPSPFDQLQ